MILPRVRTMFFTIAILHLPLAIHAEPAARLLDLAFDSDGTHIVVLTERSRSCALEVWTTASLLAKSFPLAVCPARIDRIPDGTLLLSDGGPGHRRSSWWFSSMKVEKAEDGIVTARTRENYVRRDETGLRWFHDGKTTRLPASLRFVRILSMRVLGVQPGKVSSLVTVSAGGERRVIATGFGRVDSIAVSPDEKEMAISARRAGGFDIALVSLESGKIHWVGSEPADETAVSWAPRGNKITFLLKSFSGAVLRTVHVPTGYQLAVDLPGLSPSKLAWDPQAEHFALISSAPSQSDRIEVMKYDGEARRTIRPPDVTVAVEWESFAGIPHAYLIRPSTLSYNKRYPLIVWFTEADPLNWSAGRSVVARDGTVGLATIPAAQPDSEVVDSIRGIPWVDQERIVLVFSSEVSKAALTSLARRFRGVTVLSPGAKGGKPPGSEALLNGGTLIRYNRGQTDDVESEVARQALDRVKGLLKANGDS